MSFRGTSGDRVLRALSTNALSGKGPLTFDRVTTSQAGMHYFLKFCSEEDLSSETLLFWIEARSYAQLGAGIHREIAARKIFAKFFAPAEAHMPVSLSADLVDGMAVGLQSPSGPSARIFDGALTEVSYTLRYDVFPRFLTSSHYFKLVNLTLEERMRMDIVRALAEMRIRVQICRARATHSGAACALRVAAQCGPVLRHPMHAHPAPTAWRVQHLCPTPVSVRPTG